MGLNKDTESAQTENDMSKLNPKLAHWTIICFEAERYE